ncbi:MAG: DUF4912 domain-containing protein [Calditerrivibrio sp.]|nr:DUF4912 domain-containing protein [Calditerrivibrio sp.]
MKVFENLSRKELYEIAKARNIKGRTNMTKEELINAIEESINVEQLVEKSKYDPDVHELLGYAQAENTEKALEKEDYQIPQKYDLDFLMFLPIDAKRAYVCWEITEAKIRQFISDSDIRSMKVKLKLFTDKNGEISSVDVDNLGNYFFINGMLEDSEAWSEIGLYVGDKYISVLKSNSFKMPSEHISERDDALYMTVRSSVERIINISLQGMDGYYSSIELYKNVFKMVSSKNNSEWR